MLMFIFGISCLTTSNLPWFMDLTFQVPMQYCSLQHRTSLPSPVTPTTGCCFCFGSISSFFLELFLHQSPVAYWAPDDLGNSSLSALFAFSYCSWDSQGKNTEVVCHSLLHWTTFFQNSPPWPVHLGWPNTEWAIVSEAQTGIKITGGNMNNLRYADDTTLIAESEEEIKRLLMKVIGEWKSWLKTQH